MVSVFLFGGAGKQKSASALREILRRNFEMAFVAERQILSRSENPDFVVVEMEHLAQIAVPRAVVLCLEPFDMPEQACLPPDAVGLLSSDNLPAAEFIRRCQIRAMTLGMSSKDTLTLSSITQDRAVLCLQRGISDLSGNILDPVEIPLSLSRRYDAFSILCAAAVLMLSGQIDILKQILF
ncbi:MAG: hypothetical protein PHE47_01375 [Oscillospiraceae bacterium]|nr:hypothetical protein [Oscillospiraceae bacterium]